MPLTSILVLALLTQAPVATTNDLATTAEKTDYRASTRYDDVVALCKRIAERSPNAVYTTLGETTEGRALPLLILADPPVKNPAEAARSGKPVVLAIGDIHGGEVGGKEALLMLARELTDEPHPGLLKDLIVAIAPILNADGDSRVSKANRPHQNGPEEGVGVRGNARGLDLNRDFIKLEAPETRALVAFVNAWDPSVFIDTHATNGSRHRYAITYDGPRNPAGDPGIIQYARETMFPAVTEAFEKATGLQAYYYGTFGGDFTRWEGFPALGRFATNYVGLRNRLSILCEAYAYAPFKVRVAATRDFVRECLKFTAARKDEIKGLLDAARKTATVKNPAEPRRVVVRNRVRPLANAEPIQGFDGDESKDYPADVLVDFEAVETVDRPFAYVLPPELRAAVALLQRHGIEVRELREDVELDLEIDTVDAVEPEPAGAWDRQNVVEVKTTRRAETRRVPAGFWIVKDAQPLGTLAAYLLEPRSEDGLATWRIIAARPGADFPVTRLPKPTALLTAAAENLADVPVAPRPITFDVAGGMRGPGFSGSPVTVEWIDADHWVRRDEDGAVKVDARTGRSVPFGPTPEKLLESLGRIPSIDAKAAEELSRRLVRDGAPDPARAGLLFHHEHDLYYVALDGSWGVRLTNDPAEETDARFSPDGKRVAFVKDYDLRVVDLETAEERALTEGGSTDLRRGRADWVYFEEIFNRSWSAYWWSPDSRRIAFLEFDDAEVPTLTMLHDEDDPRRVEVNRYPRSGEPNPKVRLGIVAAEGGPVQWADLSDYSADSSLISGVFWRPDSRAVLACVQDRVQTWLDLLNVPVDGSEPHALFRDATEAWIADPTEPGFLADGSFYWLSARDGWPHLYHYAADGALLGRLTEGEWEVRSIQHVDPRTGAVAFLGTMDAPMATQLYRVEPGGPVERITSGTGSYQIHASPDGKLFVAGRSDLATPTRATLLDADGGFVRVVDSNPVHKIKEYRFGPRERVRIPTRDGFALEGEVILPPDLDPSVKHPVWFTTYGGPHTPVIVDAWAGGRAWDQALASEGFVVFRGDPRPASGKGAASAWTAYKKLGLRELEDIKDAIAWLKRRPYVDGDRIGMTGHSYGGYMTAFAMTHSDLFACGIAGAPVTDWRDYDSIYTERLMGLPQDNPDGYTGSSVVEAAKNLHGKLLIVHGAVDDNVSVRNTMRLVLALQAAEKDFELMIYPGSRHGITSPHYARLMIDFIRRNLKEPKAATAAP